MSDLLPEILRNYGVTVNDGDDIKVLDDIIMKQDEDVRAAVEKDFIKGLIAQHGSKIEVPDEYLGYKFPLHVITWQALNDKVRPWSDVDVVLRKLPPPMAKDALMRTDGYGLPLHVAAALEAPRSVIDRMLSLAPDAARVKSSDGWLPLHHAADRNNVDAIEPLMNAYPDALLETSNYGETPMDEAIYNRHGDEFLKNVLLAAMNEESTAKFQNYGTLLENESLYNGSINPVNIILLECIHNKRSPEDVVEFIKQLRHKPVILRWFVYHTMKSDTESSPGSNARKITFSNEEDREFVLNALKNAGDNKEILASHNASSGLDDSPYQGGPDRLDRLNVATAAVNVIKQIEGPTSSVASSLVGSWGSGKSQTAIFIVKQMTDGNPEPKENLLSPTVSFVLMVGLFKKYVYDRSCCQSSSDDQSLSDGNRVGADVEIITSDRYIEDFFDLCCCRNIFMLPIMCVKYCFKQGVRHIPHDEESGVDLTKLNENQRSIFIGICLVLSSPLAMIALIYIHLDLHLADKEFKVDEKEEEYQVATLVLETLFRSHPQNRLPPIMNILSKIVFFIPRMLYCIYDNIYQLYGRNYYEPYLRVPKDTTYIDVWFNVWEYSGSDNLWASFISKLYAVVEKQYTKEEINIYKLACDKIGNPSPDRNSVEFKTVLKQLSETRARWNMFIACFSAFVGALVVWSIYGFSADIYDATLAAILAIVSSIAVFVKCVLSVIELYHKSRNYFGKKFEKIRSSANPRKNPLSKRRDYQTEKGFMGDVKEDMDCLLGFLRARNGRLVVVIDDLDRCVEDDIVDILKAVNLLLRDSPITCFLTIDSRVVLSVLDKRMEEICSDKVVDGREFLDKIIQLPIYIGEIRDEKRLKNYIEFSSEGTSLDAEIILRRIKFLKENPSFGVDFSAWDPDQSINNSSEKMLLDAAKYLRDNKRLDNSVIIPSLEVLRNDKEIKDKFLLDISRALRPIADRKLRGERKIEEEKVSEEKVDESGREYQPTSQDGVSQPIVQPSTYDYTEQQNDSFVVSEYEEIYSPLLNDKELKWFHELSFMFPRNPRGIKRILNIYSLAREVHRLDNLGEYDVDKFRRKLIKFIILLERWPHAMALILEVKARVGYELDKRNLFGEALYAMIKNDVETMIRNSPPLTHELSDGIDFKSYPLHIMFVALERKLLYRDEIKPGESFLLKDDDLQLLKNCLCHKERGSDLLVKDLEALIPYAYNMNTMLLECASEIIYKKMNLQYRLQARSNNE